MPVNLRPLSDNGPLEIEIGEYDRLVAKNEGGWSHCSSETEWLAGKFPRLPDRNETLARFFHG